jgi:hypothetical protein
MPRMDETDDQKAEEVRKAAEAARREDEQRKKEEEGKKFQEAMERLNNNPAFLNDIMKRVPHFSAMVQEHGLQRVAQDARNAQFLLDNHPEEYSYLQSVGLSPTPVADKMARSIFNNQGTPTSYTSQKPDTRASWERALKIRAKDDNPVTDSKSALKKTLIKTGKAVCWLAAAGAIITGCVFFPVPAIASMIIAPLTIPFVGVNPGSLGVASLIGVCFRNAIGNSVEAHRARVQIAGLKEAEKGAISSSMVAEPLKGRDMEKTPGITSILSDQQQEGRSEVGSSPAVASEPTRMRATSSLAKTPFSIDKDKIPATGNTINIPTDLKKQAYDTLTDAFRRGSNQSTGRDSPGRVFLADFEKFASVHGENESNVVRLAAQHICLATLAGQKPTASNIHQMLTTIEQQQKTLNTTVEDYPLQYSSLVLAKEMLSTMKVDLEREPNFLVAQPTSPSVASTPALEGIRIKKEEAHINVPMPMPTFSKENDMHSSEPQGMTKPTFQAPDVNPFSKVKAEAEAKVEEYGRDHYSTKSSEEMQKEAQEGTKINLQGDPYATLVRTSAPQASKDEQKELTGSARRMSLHFEEQEKAPVEWQKQTIDIPKTVAATHTASVDPKLSSAMHERVEEIYQNLWEKIYKNLQNDPNYSTIFSEETTPETLNFAQEMAVNHAMKAEIKNLADKDLRIACIDLRMENEEKWKNAYHADSNMSAQTAQYVNNVIDSFDPATAGTSEMGEPKGLQEFVNEQVDIAYNPGREPFLNQMSKEAGETRIAALEEAAIEAETTPAPVQSPAPATTQPVTSSQSTRSLWNKLSDAFKATKKAEPEVAAIPTPEAASSRPSTPTTSSSQESLSKEDAAIKKSVLDIGKITKTIGKLEQVQNNLQNATSSNDRNENEEKVKYLQGKLLPLIAEKKAELDKAIQAVNNEALLDNLLDLHTSLDDKQRNIRTQQGTSITDIASPPPPQKKEKTSNSDPYATLKGTPNAAVQEISGDEGKREELTESEKALGNKILDQMKKDKAAQKDETLTMSTKNGLGDGNGTFTPADAAAVKTTTHDLQKSDFEAVAESKKSSPKKIKTATLEPSPTSTHTAFNALDLAADPRKIEQMRMRANNAEVKEVTTAAYC